MAAKISRVAGQNADFLSDSAGIQPHQLDLVYATTTAFLAAKSAKGNNSASAEEGDLFYDSTLNSLQIHDGSGWRQVAASGAVQYAEVALTNAQIKALRATPVELVAAPGAGLALEFVSALLLLDYGSNVFTETADNLAVRYENGTGALVSQAIESTGFIDQAADTLSNALPKIDAIVAKTGAENKSLVLHNTGDGELAGNAANDSLLRVKVAYRVHATGW